jgi:signal transduction histidine kinase
VIVHGIDLSGIDDHITITEEMEMMLDRSRVFSTEELKEPTGIIEVVRGELVVPLNIDFHPGGFMILGGKRSGRSYTIQDVQILSLLGRRIVSLFHMAELYQKELDRKLMLERERTRIAKDFHDDVGASLTRISILAQMIKSNDANPETNKQWLQRISDTCREASQGITSIIWALNAKNDTTEGMVAYIRRFVLEFLEETPIQCSFSIPEDLPDMGISAEIRRNIYLCVRESLNNLVKYSGATKLCISIVANDGDLQISVKDNGKGFDSTIDRFPGNGLLNMEKRMKDINGSFHFKTSPGKGTEISFSVPVRPKAI